MPSIVLFIISLDEKEVAVALLVFWKINAAHLGFLAFNSFEGAEVRWKANYVDF